jgi:DNA-binding transcriptional LysR family regulator
LIDPGLSVRRLGTIDFCLVASPDYLRQRQTPQRPEDIRDHPFVALRPPAGERRIELQRGQETVSVGLLPVAESNDPDVVLEVCRHGGGVGALPQFLVAEDLRSGTLSIVLSGWAPHAAEILVVFSAQTAPPLRVRAFLDHLFGTLGQEKPWETGLDV